MKRGTPDHLKTRRLADALHLPVYAAVGILEMICNHLTPKYALRGDIGRISDPDLAFLIGWEREPAELIEALVTCRIFDRHPVHRLLVHDWHDHADQSVRKTLKTRGLVFATLPDNYTLPEESGPIPEESGPIPESITATTATTNRQTREIIEPSSLPEESGYLPEGYFQKRSASGTGTGTGTGTGLGKKEGGVGETKMADAHVDTRPSTRTHRAYPPDLEPYVLAYESRMGGPPPMSALRSTLDTLRALDHPEATIIARWRAYLDRERNPEDDRWISPQKFAQTFNAWGPKKQPPLITGAAVETSRIQRAAMAECEERMKHHVSADAQGAEHGAPPHPEGWGLRAAGDFR